MIRVYHIQQFAKSHSLGRVHSDSFHRIAGKEALTWAPVADVKCESLDVAYEKTNTIDRAWWDNAEVHVLFKEAGCRSTSVGDILVDRDMGYLCASFGWTCVGPMSDFTKPDGTLKF